jgi:hypothetical protein
MSAWRWALAGSTVVSVNGIPRSISARALSHVTVNSRAVQPFCSAQRRSLWAGVPS